MNQRLTPPSKQEPPAGSERRRGRPWTTVGIVLAIAAALLFCVIAQQGPEPSNRIPYSELVEQVRADRVASITIKGDEAQGTLTTNLRLAGDQILGPDDPVPPGVPFDEVRVVRTFETTIPPDAYTALLAVLEEHGVTINAEADKGSPYAGILNILLAVLPLLVIVGLVIWMSRGLTRTTSGALGFGRAQPKINDPTRPQVTFADVAGEDEAKAELSQVVDFLRYPYKYHRLGARLPRGILLIGPPGTGKTLLARAVAGEAGVPFFSISASEFVELFVGVGASRVRDLFEKAKASAPAIIFIDELDAVGRQRFAGIGGGNDEREQTLNQLLVELDGFETSMDVVVLAATNRPDVLDPALLRPGRFDRRVALGLPDRKAREAILLLHARSIPLAPDVDLAALAAATPGFAGADLANLVNEAALTAAKRNARTVDRSDFDAALDRIVLGTARPILLGEREQRILAYHEAGHALVAARTPGTDPLRKISIVPRGMALGVTVQTPTEDHVTYGVRDLLGRLTVLMGGRAAELVVFGEASTGAQNDLKEATALARKMVGLWGMSEEIGPYFLGTGEEHVFLGRELAQERELGQLTLDRAEAAAQRLLRHALGRARALLVTNRADLDRLAGRLIVEETLDKDKIAALIGPPPVIEPTPTPGIAPAHA